MSVSAKIRINRLQLDMSPRQHVFAMMEAARRAGSITAAARAAAREFGSGNSVLDRVAASVVKAMRGQPAIDINRATRRAQREALYLCKLFRACNFTVVTHEREWSLARLVVFLGLGSAEQDDEMLEALVRFAWMHWFGLEKHRLAFKDIQETEFGGTDVLLPHERSVLSDELAEAARVVEVIKRVAASEPWSRPKIPDLASAAQKCAADWRALARCEVHGAFGEDWNGMRLACQILDGDNASDGVHSASE